MVAVIGNYDYGFGELLYSTPRGRKFVITYFWFDSLNNCLYEPLGIGIFPEYTYGDGIGLTHFFSDGWYWFNYSETKLLYYRKGIETWGNPLNCANLLAGIPNNLKVQKVNLYPNPFNDSFTFYSSPNLKSQNAHIEVYNSLGKLAAFRQVQQNENHKILFDTDTWPAGLYTIKWKGDNIHQIIKAIKID